MSKELEALDGLAQFIIMNDNGTDESASAIEWHGILKQAIIELEDLRESNNEMRKLLDEFYNKFPKEIDCSEGGIK